MLSEFAKLLTLYGEIDEATSKVYKRYSDFWPCSRGCDWCCHRSLFNVSATEAACILTTLSKDKYRMRRVRDLARGELSRFHLRNGYGKWKTLVERCVSDTVVCPLLENGSCSIYEVRPVPCRVYGVSGLTNGGKTMYACPKVEIEMRHYLQDHETIEVADFSKMGDWMEGVLSAPMKPLIAWLAEM